jgi:CO/xanthine dehydrogenase Mo-binding subunit
MFAKQRIDGDDKVRGKKVFASDIRPCDMEGWPHDCNHVLLVRNYVANSQVKNHKIDNLPLSENLAPIQVIDYEAIISAKLKLSKSKTYGTQLFAQSDKPSNYIGQPCALLIFDDYNRHYFASRELREVAAVHWQSPGKSIPVSSLVEDLADWEQLSVSPRGNYAYHFFNTAQISLASVIEKPSLDRANYRLYDNDNKEEPQSQKDAINDELWAAFRRLSQLLSSKQTVSDDAVIYHETFTQTTDNLFLEPESGIGWFDPLSKTLQLVLGTQAPSHDRTTLQNMFEEVFNRGELQIIIHPKDMGGGFGGRDFSPFVIYLAIAAYFSAPVPVRLAFDRFEQFLSGIKRHPSAISSRLLFNSSSKELKAYLSSIVLGAGGEANLTNSITQLAALHAAGPYRVNESIINAISIPKPGPTAASARGFGIPQACFHIETLMDRLAAKVEIDPIQLRKEHVLKEGDRDVTGFKLDFDLATDLVLERAEKHDLWVKREALRQQHSNGQVKYGVGFACCMEAYGTSSDGVFGLVQLEESGQISIRSDAVDMGQGSRTALQGAPFQYLGRLADQVILGEQILTEKDGKEVWVSPFEVLSNERKGSTSSASKTAFFHLHPIEQACRLIRDNGVIPAALSLWGLDENTSLQGIQWRDRNLELEGYRPLDFIEIVRTIRNLNLLSGVMVHASFKNGWSKAEFEFGQTKEFLFLDALALDYGFANTFQDVKIPEKSKIIEPSEEKSVRSVYASGGHIVGLWVDVKTGDICLDQIHCILDAGDPVHPELLHGQIEGGLVMGLSYALYEKMPEDLRDIPFQNLHQYKVPRLGDVLDLKYSVELVPLTAGQSILPGDQPMMRKKGIAEATMTTIAPAIANAIAHALNNVDFLNGIKLPITRAQILSGGEQG